MVDRAQSSTGTGRVRLHSRANRGKGSDATRVPSSRCSRSFWHRALELSRIRKFAKHYTGVFFAAYSTSHDHFEQLHSIFLSAKEQYEGGYLFDVRSLVHAAIFSDELSQAEHLLSEHWKTPAAVIAGVALETTLRELCEQHPDLEPNQSANRMNQELAKAGVYSKMVFDQIQAWMKIRNSAAHGRPEEFDENDVKRMIDGVRDSIANHMS